MIKFNSLQDFVTNCNSEIDSLDYWDNLKKCNLTEDYFLTEPNWGDMPLYKQAYIVSKIHYLFPKMCGNWVFDNKFILGEPYFPHNITNGPLRLLLMIESPIEFKMRNIYISDNALRRV